MPYKNGEYYDDGKSSTLDDIRDGTVQDVKDFFQNPVKETLRAQKDFNRDDDLSSGLTKSGESSEDENDSSDMNNGAASLEQEFEVARW